MPTLLRPQNAVKERGFESAQTACLREKMSFKFSWRPDDVREEVLAQLTEAGVTHVYLGVEAGDPDSLKTLNNRVTAVVHLRAGEVHLRLNLNFDFGFTWLENGVSRPIRDGSLFVSGTSSAGTAVHLTPREPGR